jgi:hypothetical protein
LGSVFCAREIVEQKERSKAQPENRKMGPEDIVNLLLLRKRVTSIRPRYITALAFVRVQLEAGKRAPWLLGAPCEKAKVGTEAEALDAELERGAVAAAEALEERLKFAGTGDVLFDFGKLAGGEFFPAGADGRIVAEAAEEELDFSKCEAHVAGKADK